MKKGVLLLVTCLLPFFCLAQNCNGTVSLPEDTIVCGIGIPVQIDGIIPNDAIELQWSPITGIQDTTIAQTTIQADVTTTYTLTAFTISDVDLIVNGDFSQGNTGFSSDYQLKTGSGNLNEGQYAIARRPRDVHGGFARYNDHTSGNGNMLVVNASGTTNNIWCQDITVTPGTAYQFSAWVASAVSENPGELQFSINGVLLGENFKASSTTGLWEQFSAFWIADAATTAQICVVNVNQSPVGNDLTLDDIEFRELCQFSDDITIEVIDLNAEFTIDQEICQNEAPIDLNNLLSTNATTGGEWTIDGNVVSQLDPQSLTPGGHAIRYTLAVQGCTEVNNNTINIVAAPSPGTPLNDLFVFCADLDTTFQLDQFLMNADPGGIWSLEDSPLPIPSVPNLPGGAIGLTDPPVGEYTIRYSVAGSANCEAAFSEFRVRIDPLPEANAGEDQMLLCESDVVILGDPNISVIPEIQFIWLDNNNEIIGNNPSIDVSDPGMYTLIVNNSITNCSSQDQVNVDIDLSQDAIEAIAVVESLDCDSGSRAAISINNIKGGTMPYSFGLNGGPLQSESTFTGLEPGTYQVLIQDSNGCETTIEAIVESNGQLTAELTTATTSEINAGDSLQLNLSINLPPDMIDSISWRPAIANCDNCQNPIVSPLSTTIYSATVFDQNGCSSEASIQVRVSEASLAYVPNVFSPNNDGVNDLFFVNSSSVVVQVLRFSVFDRWGNLVFDRANIPPNDPSFGWDGTFDNQTAASGTYAYAVELELSDGTTMLEKGELQLVR